MHQTKASLPTNPVIKQLFFFCFSRIRTSQNFDFVICESISVFLYRSLFSLPFFYISSFFAHFIVFFLYRIVASQLFRKGKNLIFNSREVLKEPCRRDLQTWTLFKILTLICFVLREESNSFSTNITETNTMEKNYWYCKCKLLIASLYSLFKASSPKRDC